MRPAAPYAAHVFDLDGVVRDFAPGDPNSTIECALGLPTGTIAATAFRPDLLVPTITGRRTFEEWFDAICCELQHAVHEPGRPRVREEMERWRTHRGVPVASTVERLEALRLGGQRTYVFTNGTDFVPAELKILSLTRLFDGLLNSADYGVAKPFPAAFAAAHEAIERDLGRTVAPAEVWFTDDSALNVDAARSFGWTAEVFSHVGRSQGPGPDDRTDDVTSTPTPAGRR